MRHPPADRPEQPEKSLLPGGGGGAKGSAHQECSFHDWGHGPGRKRGGHDNVTRWKPFDIPKELVWKAYRRVAANEGAPGVDGQTINGQFEDDLKGSLLQDLEVAMESRVLTSHPR